MTAWFTDRFDRTIAIEPNASLRNELMRQCRGAEVVAERILAAKVAVAGDLILCSHVFYYIDTDRWMATLERLSSGGVLVWAVQNQDTDCMECCIISFRRFLVWSIARQFEEERGGLYQVRVETIRAQVETPDFAAAYAIAEFMLNLLPIPDPPRVGDLPGVKNELRWRHRDRSISPNER